MGTGLGPESYAIIEQGRIGQILSNKPHDRRAIIEEAAGITKFKTRKRLAEAKLEGAKQNLTRVFDILEEVGRQVNSLKRQASKAKRYEELKGRDDRPAAPRPHRPLPHAGARGRQDRARSQRRHVRLPDSSAQVAGQENDHLALRRVPTANEAELTEARQQWPNSTSNHERTRGRLDYQAKQIGAIEQSAWRKARPKPVSWKTTHAKSTIDLESHLQALGELESQTEAAREKLVAKSTERDNLQKALQERTRTLETGRQQVLRLLGEASTLKNQLAQIDEYLAAIDRDTTRSKREEETATADMRAHGPRSKRSSLTSCPPANWNWNRSSIVAKR